MRPFFVVSRSFVAALALVIPFATAAGPRAAVAATGPTVAVSNFSPQGLTSDWYRTFEPGIALSDLVTDQLDNDGKSNVVDRKHVRS